MSKADLEKGMAVDFPAGQHPGKADKRRVSKWERHRAKVEIRQEVDTHLPCVGGAKTSSGGGQPLPWRRRFEVGGLPFGPGWTSWDDYLSRIEVEVSGPGLMV